MLSLLLMNILHGMEQEDQIELPEVFVIPGLKDKGFDGNYVTQVTGISEEKIHRVGTPASWWSTDLGQSGCMKHLKDALQNNENNYIVYANSQGTGTVLNFFAQNPQHKDKCKGMVLEAVLASGNSAIYHRLMGPKKLKINPTLRNLLKKIPGLYYVGPYLAKIYFSHSPGGDQPIKSVENLDIDGPIILVHSKQDPTLPYKGAGAIYYALRQKKNDVYLISKDGDEHIELFREPSSEPNAITVKNILASHGLSPAEISAVNPLDFSEYRPDLAELKSAHDELMAKEQNHIWIKRGLWSSVSIIMAYKTIKWLSGKILR